MNLTIVGTGYVGLVTGACFAEFGYETVCVDKDESRVNELQKTKCPFFEPGMDELLSKHCNNTKLLTFTTSLSEAMQNADIIFTIENGKIENKGNHKYLIENSAVYKNLQLQEDSNDN